MRRRDREIPDQAECMRSDSGRPWTLAGKVLLWTAMIVLAAVLIVLHRRTEAEKLYPVAGGYKLEGSSQQSTAIAELGKDASQQSTEMLLQIAMARSGFAMPEQRDQAIRALGGRKDPQIGPLIASLLQPHEDLGTRIAVAETLKRVPCNVECVSNILHYLERVYRGDPNSEDGLPLWPEVAAKINAERKQFYLDLDAVLEDEKENTLSVLTNVYGLGSGDPSSFGLELTSRLRLSEACPLLKQTQEQLKVSQTEAYRKNLQSTAAALRSSNCK
jgi:hypothetical protein